MKKTGKAWINLTVCCEEEDAELLRRDIVEFINEHEAGVLSTELKAGAMCDRCGSSISDSEYRAGKGLCVPCVRAIQ